VNSEAADVLRATRRRLLIGLTAGSCAGPLTACFNWSEPRRFTLTPVTDFPRGLAPVKWSLVVDEPTAARQIDTSRIALMDGPFRVENYANVEWTDSAPAMVQLLLIQSFQNTGRLPGVGSSRQILATDFLLLSNLRNFQIEKEGAGPLQTTVTLEMTLLRMPRRTPVATTRFDKATPVSAEAIEPVTTAFDASLADVMRRTVEWTLQMGNAAQATG
jgi:cholesterol transport system auxiliary component